MVTMEKLTLDRAPVILIQCPCHLDWYGCSVQSKALGCLLSPRKCKALSTQQKQAEYSDLAISADFI